MQEKSGCRPIPNASNGSEVASGNQPNYDSGKESNMTPSEVYEPVHNLIVELHNAKTEEERDQLIKQLYEASIEAEFNFIRM